MQTDPAKPADIFIDPFSASSVLLELYFQDAHISNATCFFWEDSRTKVRYLVTNWHNVTGKNPNTGKHLDEIYLAEPDRIEFGTFFNGDLNNRGSAGMLLDIQEVPIWLEHPYFGNKVDVVCIPLPPQARSHVIPINTMCNEDVVIGIAQDIHILGFPLKIGPERLPIWKKASIATEPMIDVDAMPKFLVDTATAKGMSGSPVVARSNLVNDGGNTAFLPLPHTRFLGVYSGRLSTGSALDAQLGIVWKASVISEIINAGKRGER